MLDSTFRFFPVQKDEEFGYVLHLLDLATNKVLALAGRFEARDFIAERGHATLVAILLDAQATLTDEILDLHDRMIQGNRDASLARGTRDGEIQFLSRGAYYPKGLLERTPVVQGFEEVRILVLKLIRAE